MKLERHTIHGKILDAPPPPPADLVARFRALPPVVAFDAMGRHGAMHHEIKPISAGMRIGGPALTVWTRATDALFVLKSSDHIRPGDVIVVDAAGVKEFCCMGDRIAWYFKRAGAAGVVVDGGVRDVVALREIGLPVFARSIAMPLWPAQGPGAINVDIQCGGLPVRPGDLILGDDDGVVVVPRDDLERVIGLAEAHAALEEQRHQRMVAGESYIDAMGMTDKVRFWTDAAAADEEHRGR